MPRRGILADIGILTAGQAAAQLLNLVALVFVARTLGSHWFGVLQVAAAVAAYVLVAAEWGLFNLGVRTVARLDGYGSIRDYVSRHQGEMWVLALVVAALGSALLPVLPFTRDDPWIFALYVLAVLPQAGMLDWVGLGLQRVGAPSAARILRSGLYALAVLLLLTRLDGVLGWPLRRWVPVLFLFSFVAGDLLMARMAARWLGGWIRPRLPRRAELRRDLGDAAPIGGANLVRRALFNADLLLLGILAAPAEAGRYAAAAKLVFVMITVTEMALAALLPRLARAWREGEAAYAGLFRRALAGFAAAAVVVSGGAVLLGEPLMDLVYGGGFPGAGRIFALLGVSYGLLALGMFCHEALIARDRQRMAMLPLAAGALTAVVVGLFCIPRWGAEGAAYGMLAGHAVYAGAAGACCRFCGSR